MPEALGQPAQRCFWHRVFRGRAGAQFKPFDVHVYHIADVLTEVVLYGMLLFSPWAFGTTESWSINLMNLGGYVLGAFWLVKWWVRCVKGYRPPLWLYWWDAAGAGADSAGKWTKTLRSALLVRRVMCVVSVGLVLFHFVSALNARANYIRDEARFEYQPCISWLPHSLDGNSSWDAFWRCLALVCVFWAVADWVCGKTSAEMRQNRHVSGVPNSLPKYLLPGRMRRVIWVMAVNGAALALEGVFQRLEGSGRLLFLVVPAVHTGADAQFGPYAYRANAAQYLNLIWPVAVGLWWVYHRIRGVYRTSHHTLLLCSAVMCAGVFVAGSRGGSAVAAGVLTLGLALLVISAVVLGFKRRFPRHATAMVLWLAGGFVTLVVFLGVGLGWSLLWPRFKQLDEGFAGRAELTRLAEPIARDYPVFGTGPGTFESVFQMYRPSVDTYWPAQLHNDWLELRITMGWVGLSMVVLGLILVVYRWFCRPGVFAGSRFVVMSWLALGGCLVHARFDFPLQIYSVTFVFVVICALLFNLSRKAVGAPD